LEKKKYCDCRNGWERSNSLKDMNTQQNYSSSVDSLEIWSSSPHYQPSTSYDSWNNIVLQNSPSRLSWEDVGSFSSLHTRSKRVNNNNSELVLDSVEEPSLIQTSWSQENSSSIQQITSPSNITSDHDLLRSVDQLLLDDGTDDGGDIFEFDMGDAYNSSLYNTPPGMGRLPYRRRVTCKFFQNGNCKAGNKCRFSHDLSPQSQIIQQQQQQQQQQQTTPIKHSSNLSTSPQVNSTMSSRFSVSSMSSPYGVTANGTKYCKYYVNGFCRNAENCPYMHIDQQQLIQLNTSFDQTYSPPHYYQQQQYTQFQSPMATIPNLSSSLPMPHTEFSPGTSPPLSDSSSSSGQDSNQPKVCPFFLKGDCRYGERCRNMHVKLTTGVGNKKKLINEESLEKFSKIPCKYYRQGHCPFGDSCYYLHSDYIVNNQGMYQNMSMYYEEQEQHGHYM